MMNEFLNLSGKKKSFKLLEHKLITITYIEKEKTGIKFSTIKT